MLRTAPIPYRTSSGSWVPVEPAPAEGVQRAIKPPIRVCHVIAGDQWAGAEAQVATLLKGLAKFPDLISSALLFSEGRLAEELRGCGVDVKVVPKSRNNFWQTVTEAAAFVRSRKIQLLHSHRYKENLLAALVAWRSGVPYWVRTDHGPPTPFFGLSALKARCAVVLERMVARYAADRFIAVSSDLRGYLCSNFNPQKVVIIPNAIDVESVRSELSPRAARKHLNLPESAHLVGSVGRLQPVKRPDLFLDTARELAIAIPDARFVIAGEGQEESRLRQQAADPLLQGRVSFLGHRDDAYDVLRALDVLIITSDQEGIPMVLLEAMALGTPVVARKVGGIGEVIQDGINGVLVTRGNPKEISRACVTLLQDAVLRERLVRAARAVVIQKFGANRLASQTREVYLSVLHAGVN